MAKGRKPKTTEDLEIQGTYRKDRHASRVAVAEVLTESPVEWLTEEEKALWTKWYGVLQKNDILKETDEVAFGLLCKTFRRIQILQREIVDASDYVVSHKSDVGAEVTRRNPKYEILESNEKNLLRLLTEFGMTPASRSKVKTAVETGEDPFEAAMKSA